MVSLREIRRRINSIRTTQKITEAMQRVSSAKLQKAQSALGYILPYEERLHYMLLTFIHEERYLYEHGYPRGMRTLRQTPFAIARPINYVSIIFIASDTGLCGSYNANMEKKLLEVLDEYAGLPRENITLYPVGMKMLKVAEKTGCKICGQFINLMAHPDYRTCESLSRKLGIGYIRGKVDKAELIFYHFKNMAVQILQRDTFLPFQSEMVKSSNPSFGRQLKGKQGIIIPQEYPLKELDPEYYEGYIIEPSRQELIDHLLPKVLRFHLYRAVLDANASEHAARTIAMKAASENAEDLIRDLTLQYNKSRQQAITNEILDIVGGTMK
ncbi:MAG: ATP synthase F1 subunit gamma [Bacteroidales bacterium]|jgi:F-type H+-transporting ATPase subunit gamma|nr:ATP synthase F1 subunit gamma [Bacteroidales bacterium]MDD2264153.1 ATP synthase F1 subunit gamma [Bacteroidales bacterium]MDD2831376.1 ATP synthase F1 subunit gamma [Bacteroidales bacterium]MDD3208370.1 ATP synthase F1 subunit gamma [Bacteroidales bacterium]MDD3696947.1 ATP synthase F1 subunit gamma [Bacteroidales bacterium]